MTGIRGARREVLFDPSRMANVRFVAVAWPMLRHCQNNGCLIIRREIAAPMASTHNT